MHIIYNPQLNSVCIHVHMCFMHLYMCASVYMCTCACVYVCKYTCVHMYMCTWGDQKSMLSVPLQLTYLKQAFLLNLKLTVWLDWLAGKSQESPESHLLPEIGYRCVLLCPAFMWRLGI